MQHERDGSLDKQWRIALVTVNPSPGIIKQIGLGVAPSNYKKAVDNDGS